MLIYQVIASVTSAILFVIWAYAASGRKLIEGTVNKRIIDLYSVRLLIPAVVFLITVPLTMYSPIVAEISWITVLPLSYFAMAYFKIDDPRYYS